MTRLLTSLLLLSLLIASPLLAEAPSVDEIITRANHVAYYQGQDGRAQITMTIADAKGRKRTRELVILRKDAGKKDEDGKQLFYAYFKAPADVKGTVFLVWKNVGKDDDRWLYLPALDLVKRIAASDERTSFVGSHFFYEDVSGRSPQEDTHELVETTDNYYVVNNSPKNPSSVEFDSYKVWLHKVTYLPIKIEYSHKNNEVYRVYEALEVKNINGFPTVVKAKMKDLRTGGETIAEYAQVKYDIGFSEDIFTERFLKNPPLEYLE